MIEIRERPPLNEKMLAVGPQTPVGGPVYSQDPKSVL
jgi:hypothetical protein